MGVSNSKEMSGQLEESVNDKYLNSLIYGNLDKVISSET